MLYRAELPRHLREAILPQLTLLVKLARERTPPRGSTLIARRRVANTVISPRRRRREEITNRKGGEEVRRLNQNKKPQGKTVVFIACAADLRHRLVPFTADEVS